MIPRHEWLDNRLRLALLKENAAYRDLWDKHGAAALADIGKLAAEDPGGLAFKGDVEPNIKCLVASLERFYTKLEKCGIWDPRSFAVTYGDWLRILNILNPYSDENPDPCPIHFERPLAVCGVGDTWWRNSITVEEAERESSVRVLAIDLSRKKSEIIDQVSRFIDHEDWRRQFFKNSWDRDITRQRKETWEHLTVWRLRRQRKSFLQIFRETGIRVDAAKKAFARAYELIEGKRYDQDRFKEAYKEIKAPELKKTCTTCPERDTCTDLCPDVLAFINQDQACTSELVTSTGK